MCFPFVDTCRVSPRRARYFSCSAKKSIPKKAAPTQRPLRGFPACGGPSGKRAKLAFGSDNARFLFRSTHRKPALRQGEETSVRWQNDYFQNACSEKRERAMAGAKIGKRSLWCL